MTHPNKDNKSRTPLFRDQNISLPYYLGEHSYRDGHAPFSRAHLGVIYGRVSVGLCAQSVFALPLR